VSSAVREVRGSVPLRRSANARTHDRSSSAGAALSWATPPRRLALIVLALTIAKLLVAALTPLAFDEALYWRYSKHLAAGYMDHPFMNPLMIRVGTSLFGDTPLGVRVMAVLSGLPASWALWQAALWLSDSARLATTAALFFNVTLLLSVGGMVATSDQWVVATSTGLLLALAGLERSGGGRWWLAVGAAFGLGLCAKYTTVFFSPGVALWLALTPGRRRWLASPWPWAGALVAALIFAPVLVWNARHGWASFVYQSGRLSVWRWSPRTVLEFLGALVVLATPPVFILACAGLVPPRGDLRTRSGHTLLVVLVAPLTIYLLWHSTHERVQGNWPAPVYPALCVLAAYAAGRFGEGQGARGRIVFWSARLAAPVGLVLAAAVYLELVTGILPFGSHDPRARVLGLGWPSLARQVDTLRARNRATAILTTDYILNSWTRWYLPSATPVEQVNERMRWTNEPLPPLDLGHTPALYLCRNECGKLWRIRRRFRSVRRIATLDQSGDGHRVARYGVYLLREPTGPVFDSATLVRGADHAD
jgi:4-amino-4-deoxy-L-arabinose transferase-like glycosyltransferase